MTIAMQPIYTQTVGSGGASSITFNSIPQTFTDLKITISIRTTFNGSNDYTYAYRFNGNSAGIYSHRTLKGNGSSAVSINASGITYGFTGWINDASTTSNTFTSSEIYIPNYTNSNFKSQIVDTVTENNATLAYQTLHAGLWSNTAAINSVEIFVFGQTIQQHSSVSLYGITKG
jgi:hypothetical protein